MGGEPLQNADRIIAAVERYADMVLRIAMHNLKNRADAEDATQEVFLRLLQHAPAFETEEHQKRWLIRVTINVCKDHWKSAWVRKTQPLEKQLDSEASQAVFEELWCLPKKQRNLLYLYYYEGYTVPEIAGILHTKPKAVYAQLDKARKQLKHIMLEGGADQ